MKKSNYKDSLIILHCLISLNLFYCLGHIDAFAPSSYLRPSITPSLKSRFIPITLESTTTQRYLWREEDDIEGPDRLKSCVPYILPLVDGDSFGKYIYMRIPPLKFLDEILLSPLVHSFQQQPLLYLSLFALLSLGPRLIGGMSRSLRFNIQQAVLIDFALIIPTLISQSTETLSIPRSLAEPSSNFVYYTCMATILYSVLSSLKGKKPDQIPFVSAAAEMFIGPF